MVINYAATSNGDFKSVAGINKYILQLTSITKNKIDYLIKKIFFSDNTTINTTSEQNFTTIVDLSKAGAKVGDKGVLQAIYIGNETWYQCADINVVAASSFVGTSGVAYFIIVLA